MHLPAASAASLLLAASALTQPPAPPCPYECGAVSPVAAATVLAGLPRAQAVFDEDGPGPLPARLFVGGDLSAADGLPVANIARWDGQAWSAVGGGGGAGVPGASESILALQVHDDGSGPALYAAGRFTSAGGQPAPGLARWTGAAWQALPPLPPPPAGLAGGVPSRLAVLPAAGGAEQIFVAARYWDDLSGECGSILAYRLAGGAWVQAGAPVDNDAVTGLVAFDPDDGGPAPAALYMTTQSTSTHSCAGMRARLLRLSGPAWQQVATGEPEAYHALAVARLGGQPRLCIAGRFGSIGGAPANNVAAFDGASFSALGNGLGTLQNTVYSLGAFDPDGPGPAPETLIAAGYLSLSQAPAWSLARWNGASWEPFAGELSQNTPVLSLSLAQFDPDGPGPAPPLLPVAGPITTIDQRGAGGFAAYDGSGWIGPAPGPGGPVMVVAMHNDGSGRKLFVGGQFASTGQAAAANIARWDGQAWAALGAGVSGPVHALAPHNDGGGFALFAAGDFQAAGGAPAQNIARWRSGAWSAVGAGLNGPVRALEVHDEDGPGPAPAALFAAGSFTMAGGIPANGIARWDGAAWTALGPGLELGIGLALKSFDDGQGPALYAGGTFQRAGGVATVSAARWRTGAWSAMPGLVTGAVHALGVYDAGKGHALYAGGRFGTGSGLALLARFDGQSLQPIPSPPPTPGGQPEVILAMRTFDDGGGQALFVGGASGQVAKLHKSDWVQVHPRAAPGPVRSFSVPFDLGCGPALFLGGSFTSVGPRPAAGVAVIPRRGPSCPCYANCDNSTAPPILNVADFSCFLQRFAAADPYANCDNSTAPPTLNVADFSCFLQKFAAGCP
ncbi:MAG: hypothetical protein WD749_13195 [Phycisphaerales bacterium]